MTAAVGTFMYAVVLVCVVHVGTIVCACVCASVVLSVCVCAVRLLVCVVHVDAIVCTCMCASVVLSVCMYVVRLATGLHSWLSLVLDGDPTKSNTLVNINCIMLIL